MQGRLDASRIGCVFYPYASFLHAVLLLLSARAGVWVANEFRIHPALLGGFFPLRLTQGASSPAKS